MALIKGTKVFTDSGFKNIEDISGHDRVLVRNFLGEAEFTQPYALKKIKYSGEIIKLNGKMWEIDATPNHQMVINRKTTDKKVNVKYMDARDVPAGTQVNRVLKGFKYNPNREPRKQVIVINDKSFGKRKVSISPEDWYFIIAYAVAKASIKPVGKKKKISFNVSKTWRKERKEKLCQIFDKYGIAYYDAIDSGKPVLCVTLTCNLGNIVYRKLGSQRRNEFRIPSDMVLHTPGHLARFFIENFILNNTGVKRKDSNYFSMTTVNEELVNDLVVMGVLAGINVTSSVYIKKGEPTKYGIAKNNTWKIFFFNKSIGSLIKKTNKYDYSGHVYELDFFFGDILIANGKCPLWIGPK